MMRTASLKTKTLQKIIYLLGILFCLMPWINAPLALLTGIVLALLIENPFPHFNKKASKYLLQISVVGLGFGMNFSEAMKAGSEGMMFTIISVISVLFMAIFIGRWLGVGKIPSYLIGAGTAICGGSAIAAVGPIAKASESEMSVSLATIFILNAFGLFIFPFLGHLMQLSQHQFGLWAAIAIHDTSSVVGAAASYGDEALKVATTVKLTRALWIIPLSVFSIIYFKSKGERISIPWFIFLFIVAMLINSYVEVSTPILGSIVWIARKMLILTLFFIGAALTLPTVRVVGLKPMLLGVLVWIFIAVFSLMFIYLIY